MKAGGRLVLAVAAMLPGWAWALDFRSVTEPALLYDAPSRQATPRYIAARGTPVEVIVSLEGWAKVRGSSGELHWVERRLLSEGRTVQIAAAKAEVRRQPDPASPLVFEAEKDVVLDLIERGQAGWARVRHKDGQTGYVRVNQVWGL